MNLESQYQLSKVSATDGLITRRAKLYERFPVREMIKRGWIEASKSIDVLEQQFLSFFGLDSIDAEIPFAHAARKTDALDKPSMLQLAWLCRARRIAEELVLVSYTEAALRDALPRLSALLSAAEEARHASRILGECGVRFVVVEQIGRAHV